MKYEPWKITAVVGATILLMWLATLGVSSEHRAAFMGSFMAAIVAAGAVIGNSLYQDHLTRKAEREKRKLDQITAAMRIWSIGTRLTMHLSGMHAIWNNIKFDQKDPEPADEDQTVLTVGILRKNISLFDNDIELAIEMSALLPPSIASPIIHALSEAQIRFATTFRFVFISDEGFASRGNIKRAIFRADQVLDKLKKANSALKDFLKECGYVT